MKEKLTRNIGLKILSIILAAFLWLVITNVDDPMTPKSFTTEVEVLNSQAIANLGQVYDITENKTISFTATAKRTIADNLSKYDFEVTADLSKLSDLNTVIINIKYIGNEKDVKITNGLNQVMKVNLEQKEEGHYKVNVEQKGKPAKGYYVYEKYSNTILRITGPKSKIESIGEVVATVDVTDYEGASFQTSEEPKVLDKDGNEMDTSNLQFSQNSIPVYVGMYKTKTVALTVTPTGTPADGYVMTNIEYEPKTVEIAAPDNTLSSIENIVVLESISGITKDIKKEIKLQDQLPEGVILVEDNQTAVVNISIETAKKKEITISTDDLEVRNKPASCKLSYITTNSIVIRLSGSADEVADYTRGNLKPYIDLSNCKGGTYYIKIKADLSGSTTIDNSPMVTLHLIKQ